MIHIADRPKNVRLRTMPTRTTRLSEVQSLRDEVSAAIRISANPFFESHLIVLGYISYIHGALYCPRDINDVN